MSDHPLLAVPNFSEGRDREAIESLARACDSSTAQVLDVHSDTEHNRTVVTIAGAPGTLVQAVLGGAAEAMRRIDITRHEGAHPHVGAIDVAPVVHLDDAGAGAACAEALVLADRLATELELPVFLYGALGNGRARAELRRGGPRGLAERVSAGELIPDFGPGRLHPRAGAVLVAARPPLVAFNVELAPPATLEDARAVAAAIREGGTQGFPGVRALGIWLNQRGVAQVSMNLENFLVTSLAEVIAAIGRHAPIAAAELVGLAPRAALEGLPNDLEVRRRRTIEEALAVADARPAGGASSH